TKDFAEECYFHDMKPDSDGKVTTAIVNPDLDGCYGVYCTYNMTELPYFTEWKMMGEGTYVIGMEPGNALVLGRDKERELGRLQHLEPGEVREYHLEIGVVDGAEAVKEIEGRCQL